MIRSQRTGNRYLAGLVIVAAVLHLATLLISSALMWAYRDHGFLATRLILVGLVPSLAASILGIKALNETGGRSVARSTGGLILLLVAMALSRFRTGTF